MEIPNASPCERLSGLSTKFAEPVLQLKHATNYAVANALTSAYAEPDSRWAREVMGSRHAEAVETIVDGWGAAKGSAAFTGPGSGRLSASFGTMDASSPTIGDAQTLARWLAGRFPQMRPTGFGGSRATVVDFSSDP